MRHIILITATNCKDCARMKTVIYTTINKLNLTDISVNEFDSETNEEIGRAHV